MSFRDTTLPHIYVLYTMAGQEQVIISLLYSTIVNGHAGEFRPGAGSSAGCELLFAPAAEYQMKIRQKERTVRKSIYPGYIFLDTTDPAGFYNRMTEVQFYSRFGKNFRVLRDRSDSPENFYGDVLERIEDDEERTLLGICGMERDGQGMLVRKRAAEESPGSSGADALEKWEVRRGDTFEVGMSHGIKIIRKESKPGHRQAGDVRMVILNGPLKGLEGKIVKVDPHRKIAVLRTSLMHRVIDIKLPLTIVKTVER